MAEFNTVNDAGEDGRSGTLLCEWIFLWRKAIFPPPKSFNIAKQLAAYCLYKRLQKGYPFLCPGVKIGTFV